MTLLCNLNSRVYQQFMVFLPQKHGTLKGFYESVVNIAIYKFISGTK